MTGETAAGPQPSADGNPADYSFADIERTLREEKDSNDCYLIQIRDAGDYSVVQYTTAVPAEGALPESLFAWFDRSTGRFYDVGEGVTLADAFSVTEDGVLLVRTAPLDLYTGMPAFPTIRRAEFTSCAAADGGCGFTDSPYLMPLSQDAALGSPRPETLLALRWEENSCILTFGPQAGDAAIHSYIAGAETIPELTVQNREAGAVITLRNVVLGEDFMVPDDPRVYSVEADGADVVLRLDPGSAARYTVTSRWTEKEQAFGLDSGEIVTCRLVEACISYTDAVPAAAYPAGW